MILHAQNIEKSYSKLKVLKGISLEVNKGEVVSIVGSSGAGKSTLLHILGTLDRADKGRLIINSNEVGRLSSGDLARFRNKQLGFIFQFHNLLPEFSALENASMPALVAVKSMKEAQALAMPLLEKLRIHERASHKPSELSGGEQQRVAVARALINQPAIIFADEPSGNLDAENAKELHNLVFQLREEFEQTFIIVTHNPEFAAMADRKLEIKNGELAV